jgi:hypothetical protein
MFPRWLVLSIWVIVSSGVASACTDLGEAPHSRWGTIVHDSVHWLVTPCGERFFSVGVNSTEGGICSAFRTAAPPTTGELSTPIRNIQYSRVSIK